jgi:hypothetical protein
MVMYAQSLKVRLSSGLGSQLGLNLTFNCLMGLSAVLKFLGKPTTVATKPVKNFNLL